MKVLVARLRRGGRERLLTLLADLGRHVDFPARSEMEVVARRLVIDHERVGADDIPMVASRSISGPGRPSRAASSRPAVLAAVGRLGHFRPHVVCSPR